MSENGWSEDRKLVFSELKRLNVGQEKLTEMMAALRIDVARLQVKAAVYGAGAGTLIGIISALLTSQLGS